MVDGLKQMEAICSLYWLLGTSVPKIDNSNLHHPLIFLCHVVLNHESNSEIFLRLRGRIPVTLLSPHGEILKKLQPHQITISTLSEFFLQNHASPSE
jgi:hypothetical protein